MNMSTEPTRIIGWVTTAVTATVGLLIAFGANLTDAQQTAIIGVIAPYVVIALGMVEYIRSKVVSPAATGAAVAVAKRIDPSSTMVPEVQVANYKQAVVDNLPLVESVRDVNWRPTIDAHDALESEKALVDPLSDLRSDSEPLSGGPTHLTP
jgi:hypothetical protein